jgi:hypothetical protein
VRDVPGVGLLRSDGDERDPLTLELVLDPSMGCADPSAFLADGDTRTMLERHFSDRI